MGGSLTATNDADPSAAREYVHRIAVMLSEIDDPILTAQTAFEIAPIAAALEVSWMAEGTDALMAPEMAACFAVSGAKKGGDDDPSYRQAMSGPERQLWLDACANEIDNLARFNAFVEVPEDSLPLQWPSHVPPRV